MKGDLVSKKVSVAIGKPGQAYILVFPPVKEPVRDS